jgi:hypothetical protein
MRSSSCSRSVSTRRADNGSWGRSLAAASTLTTSGYPDSLSRATHRPP